MGDGTELRTNIIWLPSLLPAVLPCRKKGRDRAICFVAFRTAFFGFFYDVFFSTSVGVNFRNSGTERKGKETTRIREKELFQFILSREGASLTEAINQYRLFFPLPVLKPLERSKLQSTTREKERERE